jgi:hypothetical protein
MDYYKYWLIGNLNNLDSDIINCIKSNIRVIKPPNFEDVKLGWKDNCYIENQIVYVDQCSNTVFNDNEYLYDGAGIWIENGKITDVYFYYFMKDTLYDYCFYIDLEKSNIKNLIIHKYSDDIKFFSMAKVSYLIEEYADNIDLNIPGMYHVKEVILID